MSGKTKTYFSTAVALWDADFYVKVDDDVHVNIGKGVLPLSYILSFILYIVIGRCWELLMSYSRKRLKRKFETNICDFIVIIIVLKCAERK